MYLEVVMLIRWLVRVFRGVIFLPSENARAGEEIFAEDNRRAKSKGCSNVSDVDFVRGIGGGYSPWGLPTTARAGPHHQHSKQHSKRTSIQLHHNAP